MIWVWGFKLRFVSRVKINIKISIRMRILILGVRFKVQIKVSIVCRVLRKYLFNRVKIVDSVYKVEMCGLVLPNAPFPFPNFRDVLAQLLLKQVQGQSTLWESATMWKTT
jgi:hypothetical protein